VKPSRPPFIPQQRNNTCCHACLRMALADQGLPVPSEDELITQVNMQSEGMDFTELQRLARSVSVPRLSSRKMLTQFRGTFPAVRQ
jgi:ABC-type bacteriocin/lantibiotic exporter with double-glycine peptidase domain